MEWISIKEQTPPCCGNGTLSYVLAYHTVFGVGVAWFWKLDEGVIEEAEEDFKDKYICTAEFIKDKNDGNWSIDTEQDIDIFENSPHFHNLGTITHWMPLPKEPVEKCKT